MAVEIKVPAFPESITEGTLVTWHKQAGDTVHRDEVLADIETDKVVFELPALEDGVLEAILVKEGETVVSGQVVGSLGKQSAMAATADGTTAKNQQPTNQGKSKTTPLVAPAAAKLISEHKLDSSDINGTGKRGRILKEDVQRYLEQQSASKPGKASVTRLPVEPTTEPRQGSSYDGRPEKRVTMTRLRARVAERLLEAQHNAAILTTFNEVNMQAVMQLRKRYRDRFEEVYGVRLGYMSFFVKAVVEALKRFPEVNASIDGDDVVYHGFF